VLGTFFFLLTSAFFLVRCTMALVVV
jgi:hypothetical protein